MHSFTQLDTALQHDVVIRGGYYGATQKWSFAPLMCRKNGRLFKVCVALLLWHFFSAGAKSNAGPFVPDRLKILIMSNLGT